MIFCLLASDKPLIESLQPNAINQTDASEKHFQGMSEVALSYSDNEETRLNLINMVNACLTDEDKLFLLSFETGYPDWSKYCAAD